MDLGDLSLEDFNALVGSVVGVAVDAADRVEVEVLGAERVPGRPDSRDFSVLFRGPDEPQLSQGTYVMDLDDLGTQSLFLVPVDRSEDGFVYEAVFTRLDDDP